MEHRGLKKSAGLAIVMAVLALLAASAATYAWFTSNALADTSRVTGKTADSSLVLELSTSGGAAFKGAQEVGLPQVNTANMEKLMPVSTADLKDFVFCPQSAEGGLATTFQRVEDEASYFHGRIYMRVSAQGSAKDATVALYLDESEASGGLIVAGEGEESKILSAARLGLKLSGEHEDTAILRLSQDTLEEGARVLNTVVDGALQEENTVLAWTGTAVKAVEDPAVLYSQYAYTQGSETFPEKPIFTLKPNQIYTLDVYFYLEGCDPDCNENIAFHANELHLAFFGVIS